MSEAKEVRLTIKVRGDEVYAILGGSDSARCRVNYGPDRVNIDTVELLAPLLRRKDIFRDEDDFATFGKCLYEMLFEDGVERGVGSYLRNAWHSKPPNHRLRIDLDMVEAPRLANLPWEYLYFPEIRDFLCRHANVVLSRYIDLGADRTRNPGKELRILVAYTRPTNLKTVLEEQTLDAIKTYVDQLRTKIGQIDKVKLIATDYGMTNLTYDAFEKVIKDEKTQPDILHFIAHGEFDSDERQCKIGFYDPDKPDGDWCTDQDFVRSIEQAHLNLGLVFLQMCESGRVDFYRNMDGLVPKLMEYADIPFVVAMQHPIHGYTAVEFSDAFYRELTQSYNVGWAVQKGRELLASRSARLRYKDTPYMFGTPVLYMRSSEGVIFKSEPPSKEPPTSSSGRAITDSKPPPLGWLNECFAQGSAEIRNISSIDSKDMETNLARLRDIKERMRKIEPGQWSAELDRALDDIDFGVADYDIYQPLRKALQTMKERLNNDPPGG
jgi:hypothetical protein